MRSRVSRGDRDATHTHLDEDRLVLLELGAQRERGEPVELKLAAEQRALGAPHVLVEHVAAGETRFHVQ